MLHGFAPWAIIRDRTGKTRPGTGGQPAGNCSWPWRPHRQVRQSRQGKLMLTAEENEVLTRIGPGTRMGNLLRRYWHPVAGSSEMAERWTMRVRIMGEDLVLFKTRAGRFGLIAERCPHRAA